MLVGNSWLFRFRLTWFKRWTTCSIYLINSQPPWSKSLSANDSERMQSSHNENSSRKLPEAKSSKVRSHPPHSQCVRSSVSPVIRERYLRDDVSCGIEQCRGCTSISGSRLPFNGAIDYKQFPNGHFVLPDTNVFLSQVCSPHSKKYLCLSSSLRWIL